MADSEDVAAPPVAAVRELALEGEAAVGTTTAIPPRRSASGPGGSWSTC